MDHKMPERLQFKWHEASAFAPAPSASSSWLRRSTTAFAQKMSKSRECFEVARFATAVVEHCLLWVEQEDPDSMAQLLHLRLTHHKKLCDWLLQHFEVASRVIPNGSYKEQMMIDALARDEKKVAAASADEPGLSLAGCVFLAILSLEYCYFRRSSGQDAKICEADSWEEAGAELALMNQEATNRLLQPFLIASEQKQESGVEPDWSAFLVNLSRLACVCLFVVTKPESQDVLFNFIENTCSIWCSVKSAEAELGESSLLLFEADALSRDNFQAHLKKYMKYTPDECMTRDYTQLVCAHTLSLAARERYLRIRGSLGEITRSTKFLPEEEPLLGIARETLTPADMRQLLRDVSEKDPATMFEDAKHKYRPLLELQIFSDSMRDAENSAALLECHYISPMQWWQRRGWIKERRPVIVAIAHRLCVCVSGHKWMVKNMPDAILLLCALTGMASHLVSERDKTQIKKMQSPPSSFVSSVSSSRRDHHQASSSLSRRQRRRAVAAAASPSLSSSSSLSSLSLPPEAPSQFRRESSRSASRAGSQSLWSES